MFSRNVLISIFASTITVMIYIVSFSFYLKELTISNSDATYGWRHLERDIGDQMDSRLTKLQQEIESLELRQQTLKASMQNQFVSTKHAAQSEAHFKRTETLATKPGESETLMDSDKVQQQVTVDSEDTENQSIEEFDSLKEQVLSAATDVASESELTSALARINVRLQNTSVQGTRITGQECRSAGCLVEFTHDQPINGSLFGALVNAGNTKEVVMRRVEEGGVSKTYAIYRW